MKILVWTLLDVVWGISWKLLLKTSHGTRYHCSAPPRIWLEKICSSDSSWTLGWKTQQSCLMLFGQVSLYSSYFIDPPWISAQPTPTSPTPNLAWASLILGVVGSCLVPKTSRVLRFLVAMLLDFVTAARELALLQALDSASATGAFPCFRWLYSKCQGLKWRENPVPATIFHSLGQTFQTLVLAQRTPNYPKLSEAPGPWGPNANGKDLGANPPQNTTKITPPGPAVKISRNREDLNKYGDRIIAYQKDYKWWYDERKHGMSWKHVETGVVKCLLVKTMGLWQPTNCLPVLRPETIQFGRST